MLKNILSKTSLSIQIIALLFSLVLPVLAYAQGTGVVYECTSGRPGECNYTELIAAVVRVINWLIIFTLQFSVVVIVYAGFNYMISGDNPGKRAEANKMLTKVVWGIFFVLAAWLIVNLIARTLLTPAVINVTPTVTP